MPVDSTFLPSGTTRALWLQTTLRELQRELAAHPGKVEFPLRRTRPSFTSQPVMICAVLLAMAKQIPCARKIMAVFTPMTSPRELDLISQIVRVVSGRL